jgi:hypothetical protein
MKKLLFSLLTTTLLAAQRVQAVPLPNPLGTGVNAETVPGLINRVIIAILGIVGALALLMFVWGGLLWMTSAGNSEQVKKGRDTLVWAAIGLLIIFASYTLVTTIFKSLTGAN